MIFNDKEIERRIEKLEDDFAFMALLFERVLDSIRNDDNNIKELVIDIRKCLDMILEAHKGWTAQNTETLGIEKEN